MPGRGRMDAKHSARIAGWTIAVLLFFWMVAKIVQFQIASETPKNVFTNVADGPDSPLGCCASPPSYTSEEHRLIDEEFRCIQKSLGCSPPLLCAARCPPWWSKAAGSSLLTGRETVLTRRR